MKCAFCLISLSWTTLLCPAAEIAAWNIPLHRFAGHGGWSEGMSRCKAAPEVSPFFKEGDELWDLEGIDPALRKETSPPMEWMIWNATSGRLVVKAEQESIWQLCHRLRPGEQPRQCRLSVEILQVPADGEPPSAKSEAAARLSWITRSGKEFEAGRENEGSMINVRGMVTMAEDALLADVRMEVSCFLGDQPEMKFSSSFPTQSGKPLWLARDFDGKDGIDLRLSFSFELLDGTPVSETMLIQKGNQATPVTLDRHEFRKYRIGKKGSLAIQFLAPELLMSFSTSDAISTDPFELTPANQLREKLGLHEVGPPEVIETWFDGPVLDVLPLYRRTGILSENSTAFVGYDSSTNAVFLLSDDPRELEKFEQVLTTGCHLPPRIIIATFNGGGQTRLISTSGSRCTLERSVDEQHVIRSFVIEPLIGETGAIEVGLAYRNESKDRRKQSLKTSVTLNTGQSSLILEESRDNGISAPLMLNAVIVSVND